MAVRGCCYDDVGVGPECFFPTNKESIGGSKENFDGAIVPSDYEDEFYPIRPHIGD